MKLHHIKKLHCHPILKHKHLLIRTNNILGLEGHCNIRLKVNKRKKSNIKLSLSTKQSSNLIHIHLQLFHPLSNRLMTLSSNFGRQNRYNLLRLTQSIFLSNLHLKNRGKCFMQLDKVRIPF